MNISDSDFQKQIWKQNCGDSLKILEKTKEQAKNGRFYFSCEFMKYPYKILAFKPDIIKGSVINPKIEEYNFLNKIWKQNCGDSLKIIKKLDEKIGNAVLYECEFINYPCRLKRIKGNIINGEVLNPLIEEKEFIGKVFEQNCGDILKVIEKTKEQTSNKSYLFRCQFLNYPSEVLCRKDSILAKSIDNPNLPWKNKDLLEKYILDNFKDSKPTLQELSSKIGKSITLIGQAINKFNLQDYIKYSFGKTETEIFDYIRNFYEGKVIQNTSLPLIKKEIDIYIPDLNLGVEFNGSYWHSELFKEPNYHQEKSLLANSKGISLMHIFEYEWNEKQEILKALIKSKLGLFEKIIPARKCEIKELKNKEYQDFCNKNHLQGEAGARVKIGLFFKNELVQIISFGSPRFSTEYEWEIIRECSKLNYCILGGKEKLWSYFIKKYSPISVISYCDFSKFGGDSYIKLGFEKVRLNKPGFVWWDQQLNVTFWRNPYKNQEYKNKYIRIYDCGQLVFVWKKA